MLAHAFRSNSLKYQAKRLADYSAALIIAVITPERYIALYIYYTYVFRGAYNALQAE